MRVTIVILCLVGAAIANPIMYNTTMEIMNPSPGVSSASDSLEHTGMPELKSSPVSSTSDQSNFTQQTAQSSSESQSSEQSDIPDLRSASSSSSSEQSNSSSQESQSSSESDSSNQSDTSEQTTSESSESDSSDSSDMTSDESQSESLKDTTSEESNSLEDKFNLVENGVTRDDSRGSKENLRRFFRVYAVKATAPDSVSDSQQSFVESKEDNSISNEIPEATGGPGQSLERVSSEDSRASVDLGNSTENSISNESTENNSTESTESNEDSEIAVSHESNDSKSAECLPGSGQNCDSDSDSDESNMRDIGDDGDHDPFDGFFVPFDTPGELLLRR
ncbi:secretory calcium-binding phosphoprotein 1 [Clupea harengus]|uniref:Secretory calcium-binding phosphoprotein 1 n=1 Tax=Clupea harengus TaxID=7950 RepID=A0A6P8EYG0_CLUHA|nr:secretory calcium-binding phosphoprotein 1 [Clupea harengus]